MKQWQDKFSNHTQQWAFNLMLSRHMIAMLGYYRDNDDSLPPNLQLRVPTNHFIKGTDALENRGLIECNPRDPQSYENKGCTSWKIKLTPAGKAVCDLLVMAGLLSKPRVKLPLECPITFGEHAYEG